MQEFTAAVDRSDTRKSHHFNGRYENLYIQQAQLPSLDALSHWLQALAGQLLPQPAEPLKFGFWFNQMGAGHTTTRHHHQDDDELLSVVYYLKIPPDSGHLRLFQNETVISIKPHAGLCVLFQPEIEHEVSANNSDQTRLSIAFNFGKMQAPDPLP